MEYNFIFDSVSKPSLYPHQQHTDINKNNREMTNTGMRAKKHVKTFYQTFEAYREIETGLYRLCICLHLKIIL